MAHTRTVACVTCYFDPDYVRSRTIRQALTAMDEVRPVIIKNTSRGAWRYVQVATAIIACRFRDKPDVWLLNFRGYEMLPLVLLLAGRKPVVYDEFINPVLVVQEHRRLKHGLVHQLMGLWVYLGSMYYWLVRRCRLVLTDTPEHARYSSQLSGVPKQRFIGLPVGTDEQMFTARTTQPAAGTFQVFTYSFGVQPLHGVPVMLQAAELLKDEPGITFVIAGNKGSLAADLAAAVERGAHITHRPWIPFTELPDVIKASALCLGGPFGGTTQAGLVVTGKTYQFMACAVPVVVGQAAYRSAFKDKQNALVVPQNDARALADAILWAYTHQKELPAIATAGRAAYDEHFSQRVINADIARLIRSLD